MEFPLIYAPRSLLHALDPFSEHSFDAISVVFATLKGAQDGSRVIVLAIQTPTFSRGFHLGKRTRIEFVNRAATEY